MTATSNSKRYHHGDLKKALINAAVEMIAEQGMNGFSLRKVAQVVGVSQSALYRHFSSKDDLLARVAELGFHQLAEESQQAYFADRPARMNLRACGVAYVSFAQRNPNLYRLMFDAILSDHERFADLGLARKQAFKWPSQSLLLILKAKGYRGSKLEEGKKLFGQAVIHGLSSLVIEGLVSKRQDQTKTIEDALELMVPYDRNDDEGA